MSNLFKNKIKLLYFGFGVLMFITLIASVMYMTNYAYIHVYYSLDQYTGAVVINAATPKPVTLETNQLLFDYIAENTNINIDTFKFDVYNFQVAMSDLNSFFITFCVIGLIAFAALLICANHSRRVYYKSNIVCGILAPLVTIVFAVICLIRNISLMGVFNANFENFNMVSMIQNPVNIPQVIAKGKEFVTSDQPCNSLTFILFAILFAIIIIYSLVLIVVAIKKYNDTKELREEIIRRAVENNG